MKTFTEIWIEDFEYRDTDGGNNPTPVCVCMQEIYSGKEIRLWLDGVDNPTPPINYSDPDILIVAFQAVAEISCHLVLNWPIPENVLDLFCEWRLQINDGSEEAKSKSGLLSACKHYNIPAISEESKEQMRNRILQGSPYNLVEQSEILDYCYTDITETTALYQAMALVIDSWDRALFRGKSMIIAAQIENRGVPIDVETWQILSENWDTVKLELIKGIKKDFDLFDGLKFKTQKFAKYLMDNKMSWPLTDKGNLKTDEDSWKDMTKTYPHLQPLADIMQLRGKLKNFRLACGKDGRNRGAIKPFTAVTGRNAPKIECVFTNSTWLRGLIKPQAEKVVAYTDYAAQEFLIAAVLSKDQNMLDAYESGDPYLYFAKLVKAIPLEGTKKSHKPIRDLYKTGCLAIQYGTGAGSLAVRLNRPLATAQEIIRQHQYVFPKYWSWKEHVSTQAKLNKFIQTRFGWKMHVVRDYTHKEDMTIGNFLMQATGNDILRVACYLLNEKGYNVVAPVHDAVLTEVSAATADQDIHAIETIMAEASQVVIGKRLRTETVTVRYPDRYLDERGKETWQKVERILTEIRKGTLKGEPNLLLELQQSDTDL